MGGVLVGAINYLTHPVLARIMDVETYGEFEALFAILAIANVPSATILTVVKKYTSSYLSQNEVGKIHTLFKLASKYVLVLGIIFLLVLSLCSPYISSFLQISSNAPIIILTIALLASFLTAINNGILNGFQKFIAFSSNNLLAAAARLTCVAVLVWIGFALNGAILGLVLSGLLAFLFSLYQTNFLMKDKKETDIDIDLKHVIKYSIPTFFILLSLNLIYNLDIILTKHYFSQEEAGLYASIALTGRLMFFVTTSIAVAMFPMASVAHTKHGHANKILLNSILLLASVAGIFLIGFFAFPELIIKILLGEKFMGISQYLGWFGVAMATLSMLNLIIQYLLSIGRTQFVYFLTLGPALLFYFIYQYHDSLWQIIWILNGVLAFLVIGVALYFAIFVHGLRKKPAELDPSNLIQN